jgi:hypothetical protein
VDGLQYSPSWDSPHNGFQSPSLEDCAQKCEADLTCTGAAFFLGASPAQKNCWLKHWGTATLCLPDPNSPLTHRAIIDPFGRACTSIVYTELVHSCEVKSSIDVTPGSVTVTVTDLATLSALSPPYDGYFGVDYIPLQSPSPQVAAVFPGIRVSDAVGCAANCTAEPNCNAATYLGDIPFEKWNGKALPLLPQIYPTLARSAQQLMPHSAAGLKGKCLCR